MKKIFLIDDDQDILNTWRDQFNAYAEGDKFILVRATSIQEAQKEFKENQDIKVIIIDGRIIGPSGHAPSSYEEPNTLDLVAEFRKTFSGLIIAVSGDEDTRKKMVENGCSE